MYDYLEQVRRQAIGKSFVDANAEAEYIIVELGERIYGMVQLIVKPVDGDKLRNFWLCEESLAAIVGLGEA